MNQHIEPDYDAVLESPVAPLGLRFEGDYLVALDFLDSGQAACSSSPVVRDACEQLEQYFSGSSAGQFLIKTDLSGTRFQQKVLLELLNIPFGKVKTYGEIARKLKTSPRAVGNACRRNPIPVIIPCHRVVAANGIGGYDGATSGSRLAIKRQLLQHEGIDLIGEKLSGITL